MNARLSGGLLVLISLAVGCNPSADPNAPKTVPVTGTVTHKGQPVEGATVTLFAESGQGRGAIGTTDAQGKFTLTTVSPGDGAMVGTYKVSVSKTVVEGALTEEESAAYVAKGQQPPSGTLKDYLPEKYKDLNASGLTAEVKAGGTELKFDLTD